MSTKLIKPLTLVAFLLFSGCVDRIGYYTDGQEEIISLVCDITWASEVTVFDDGSTWQAVYQFKRDATYKRTVINTDSDGQKRISYNIGRWSFTDSNSICIYFGESKYWDFDILTEEMFSFYDRRGEWTDSSMRREYTVLTPYTGTDITG